MRPDQHCRVASLLLKRRDALPKHTPAHNLCRAQLYAWGYGASLRKLHEMAKGARNAGKNFDFLEETGAGRGADSGD